MSPRDGLTGLTKDAEMPGKDYSEHQKSVISGYYANLDAIMLAKLSELVSELYLAQTPTRKSQLWIRAEKAMLKLKIAPAIIRHIIERKDPQILAKNLQDWLSADNKKR
jgi:hypothetical protein